MQPTPFQFRPRLNSRTDEFASTSSKSDSTGSSKGSSGSFGADPLVDSETDVKLTEAVSQLFAHLGERLSGRIPATMPPTTTVWRNLNSLTEKALASLHYLKEEKAVHLFSNIFSPSHTACCIGGQYLHANTIQVKLPVAVPNFIAAQTPDLATWPLFWRAVADNGAAILDLRRFSDICEGAQYPENVGECVSYGPDLEVTLLSLQGNVYKYAITYGEKTHFVQRVQFNAWPDRGAIDVTALQRLVDILKCMGSNILVHCRAGVGRTGTVLVAFMLDALHRSGHLIQEILDKRLMDLILQVRRSRGPLCVQTEEQFHLLREYALWLMGNLEMQEDSSSHRSALWEQLKIATKKIGGSIPYLSRREVFQIFEGIECPSETALKLNGRYVRANEIRMDYPLAFPRIFAGQVFLSHEWPRLWQFFHQEGFQIVDVRSRAEVAQSVPELDYPQLVGEKRRYQNGKDELVVSLASVKGFISRYEVTCNGETRSVLRLHFGMWGRGEDLAISTLNDLVKALKQMGPQIFIHGLEGIGRTATLIGAFILEALMREGLMNQDNLQGEIFNVVLNLRKQRGPGCINEPQFDLLYQYGQWLIANQAQPVRESRA